MATLMEHTFTWVAKYVISLSLNWSFSLQAGCAPNCRTGVFLPPPSSPPLVSAGRQSSGRHGDLSFYVGLPEKMASLVADDKIIAFGSLPQWHACRQMC